MRISHFLPVFILLALFGLAPGGAKAQTPVDLQLVLAVDASGSVSQYRFELQRRGYAQAFRNRQVLNAIQSGGVNRAIEVTLFQWTGPRLQRLTLPWTIVSDEKSAAAVADVIEAGPRLLFGGGTSISGAIDVGMALFSRSQTKSPRRVIDISGDGSNNAGRPVTIARDEAVRAGIVINGLPILTVEPDLDRYYETSVIGGEGAFMIAVDSFEAFADAIVKKLVAEIAGLPPDRSPRRRYAQGGPARPFVAPQGPFRPAFP